VVQGIPTGTAAARLPSRNIDIQVFKKSLVIQPE
jgi:hypothetical protein